MPAHFLLKETAFDSQGGLPNKSSQKLTLGGGQPVIRSRFQPKHSDGLLPRHERQVTSQCIRQCCGLSARLAAMLPTPSGRFQFFVRPKELRRTKVYQQSLVRWQQEDETAVEICFQVMAGDLHNLFQV